ncbi:MAG: DUF481 domain-containing protein [Gammaproteobacteria bacterium]|nr:DUF481 domain-containing protein [Gammaproteobacteria bacterium]NND60792.1 DUF481 domain-containing protein [Gammaproteobacteria bacterium]
MEYRLNHFALFIALIAISSTAYAAEDGGDRWSGKVAFGVLATTGNSETTNANLNVGAKYDRERWHHTAQLAASGANSVNVTDSGVGEERETTAERYKASYKAKFDFNENDYLFGLVNYEKDKFSGYDQQISEAIGYGRRVIDNDRHVLNLEAGAGFKQADLRDGGSENGAIVRLGTDYRWQISPTSEFTQDLAVERGSDNTYIESVSALKATLVGELGLVLSYTIKNNSDVPAGSEKTDTFTAIQLEYGF